MDHYLNAKHNTGKEGLRRYCKDDVSTACGLDFARVSSPDLHTNRSLRSPRLYVDCIYLSRANSSKSKSSHLYIIVT
jgi:hypothetical protein